MIVWVQCSLQCDNGHLITEHVLSVLSSISHSWGCHSVPRMAGTHLLALLPSSRLLHTPGSLLPCAFRNNKVLRMPSAPLQFGHRSVCSHPSLPFCSVSEGAQPLPEQNLNQDPDLPRCVSITRFPPSLCFVHPLHLCMDSLFVCTLKKKNHSWAFSIC